MQIACATALNNRGIVAILLANTRKSLRFHRFKSILKFILFFCLLLTFFFAGEVVLTVTCSIEQK